MTLSRFTFIYVIYGFLLAVFAWLLAYVFPTREVLAQNFWLAFSFLFFLTYIAYLISDIGIKKSAQIGVMAVMGGIVIKLIFALSFVLIVFMKTTVNQLVFALNYFSLYLLFTLFEVMCLLRNLRHQNNK